MSLKDRGTKKWTSLMLPEHVEMLKEVFRQDEYKEKPILDEQQKVEMDTMLQCALHNDLTVEITYFADHDYKKVEGQLLMIDVLNNRLALEAEIEIKISDVIGVNVL